MDILTISGSLRKNSYNTALLQQLDKLAPAELGFSMFKRLGDIPHFNPDIGDAAIPDAVTQLREAIDQSDAIIISTPEYAHGVPGALKNALDWLVSFNEIILKPVAVMSVSTSGLGAYRAQAALIQVLHAMNTNVVIDASLNVPFAKTRFDGHGELLDSETEKALENALARITRFVKQQR